MYRTDIIKGAMAAQDLRVEDVAKLAHLAPKTVSAVRSGDKNVKVKTLKSVADVIKIPLHLLFEPKDEAASAQPMPPINR